jgi:acid phosphatase
MGAGRHDARTGSDTFRIIMEERRQSCWSKLLSRMGFAVLTVSFMVCLLATVLFLLNPTQGLALNSLRFTGLQQVLPGYLQTEQKGWDVEAPITSLQNSTDDWNILYHLGGNGPWIERIDGFVDGGVAVPSGCEVDMVHLVPSLSTILGSTNFVNTN